MKRISGAILLFLAFTIPLNGCSRGRELVLRDQTTGQVYGAWTVWEGDTFSLAFIHSVNQSPVIDVFAVEEDHLRAVKTIYSSLGAGVQSELQPGETLSYDESGRMVISGFQRTYESLNLIVGTVSDHSLTIQDKTYSLRELCGKNAAVTFAINP